MLIEELRVCVSGPEKNTINQATATWSCKNNNTVALQVLFNCAQQDIRSAQFHVRRASQKLAR